MTDRELLELAAKAAGLSHADYTGVDYDGQSGLMLTDEMGRQTVSWSPLTDDGDAFRLSLVLGIQIGDPHQYVDLTLTYTDGRLPFKEYWERIKDGDYCSATRRAIVRAAADIGREE